MNTKTLLLVVAGLLIAVGLLKPDLSQIISIPSSDNTVLAISKPSNVELLDECEAVTNALKNGSSSRKTDGKRLASLYMDISTLIELDGEDRVIKDTEEVRQANKLSGLMLRLNIKGKYPDLPDAAQKLVVASIGDDHVLLDSKLRKGAVDGFRALAWACNEGAK